MKTPAFWYRPSGFISTLLAPLSLFYGAGRGLHVAFSKKKISSALPVICIGNLVAGGSGKTPTTIALIELLKQQGKNVHIVTRGYGGTQQEPLLLKGNEPVEQVGDEPLLLAKAASTWVAKDRPIGIGCALSAQADCVLLDDGLQNPQIDARVNILVVDGQSGFGNGQMLPAGPLRESFGSVKSRLHAAIIIGEDVHKIASYLEPIQVFKAHVDADVTALDKTRKYLAFSGLARPRKFFDTCRAAGLDLVECVEFADHHIFTADERAMLHDKARRSDAVLITTEKDFMRLPQEERAGVAVLPIKLVFNEPEKVSAWLKDNLHGA